MRSGEQKPAKPKDKEVKELNIAGRTFHSETPANNKEESVRRSSFHFLKSMLNAIVNPISYKDKNGIYLGVNETFTKLVIGLPEEEIVGFTLPEIYRKLVERFPERKIVNGKKLTEICSEYNQDDIELLRSGGSKIYEQEMVLADGTRRTFFVNKSTFRDENGDIFGLVTVLQDITRLKKSEKFLEEIEERYRIVTEQTGQLVYDNNLETDRLSWAGAIEEVFGYSLEEVKNFTLEDWIAHIYPEDRNYVIEKFMQARKTGGRQRVEYRLRRKDRTCIYVEDTGTYLVNEDGRTYRVLGVVKEITEEKFTQERLEKSEEKYRSFIHNFKGIAFQLDENLLPEFIHGAVEEITGYSEEDFMSTRIMWGRSFILKTDLLYLNN